MHIVMGLILGFRLNSIGKFSQVEAIAPLKWNGLQAVPDFEDLTNVELQAQLMVDLPPDEMATGRKESRP